MQKLDHQHWQSSHAILYQQIFPHIRNFFALDLPAVLYPLKNLYIHKTNKKSNPCLRTSHQRPPHLKVVALTGSPESLNHDLIQSLMVDLNLVLELMVLVNHYTDLRLMRGMQLSEPLPELPHLHGHASFPFCKHCSCGAAAAQSCANPGS